MTILALMLVAAAAASAATLVWQRRRAAAKADERGPALDAFGPGRTLRTTIEQAMPAHLQRAVQAQMEQQESAADRAILEKFLVDVRDLMGAEEAVFWSWIEDRDTLRPWAWSTPGVDRPMHFKLGEWGPLVQWSAQERLMHSAGADPAFPQIAVVPVKAGERLHGVVSISHVGGLSMGKPAVRQWLPRHADHIARLADLFDLRRGYGRSMRQGQALLQAADRIRGHKSRDGLAQSLCTTALEVTSADQAALVRWVPSAGEGDVQFTTAGLGVTNGFKVHPDSVIGRACLDGLPIVLEDAVPLRAGELFGAGDRFSGAGSAAIVPIVREDVCIGALLITAPQPGAISHDEARNAGLLGAIAGTSLEILWESEEIDRRSRMDPLTGLANRRSFEENLQRIIAETDRFGGSGSLVLVDIDHFKRVNDTYGHQAGDQVLRQVARVLAEGVRTVDVCARYGGEELAILLPQTAVAGAFELAERLRARIEERVVRIGDHEIRVTASFGVASYPEVVNVRESLFPAADRALYQAKHDGRNCVRSAGVTRSVS